MRFFSFFLVSCFLIIGAPVLLAQAPSSPLAVLVHKSRFRVRSINTHEFEDADEHFQAQSEKVRNEELSCSKLA